MSQGSGAALLMLFFNDHTSLRYMCLPTDSSD